MGTDRKDGYEQERALKDQYEHGMMGKCGHLQGRTLKCRYGQGRVGMDRELC